MNTKKLITLAVILAAAVALIVIVNAVSNREPSEESLQFFPGISEKTIGAVILKDALDRVKIKRRGDVWVMVPNKVLSLGAAVPPEKVPGLDKAMGTDSGSVSPVKTPAGLAASEFPAESSAVAQLLENIVKIKKDILISENPAKQADFEVNAERGISIEVFDVAGKSLGAVILGKNGDSYNSNFFRPENSNAVYRVNESNRWAFGTDHKRWTDKSIMKFDRAMVQQLSIARKGAPAIVLEKSTDTTARGWRMLKPLASNVNKIDSNKVNEILGALSNFNAQEIEDSAYTDAEAGLADPSIAVTVTFVSGTVRLLAVGSMKAGTARYWVRVPEKQLMYLIGDNEQKTLNKKPEDFKVQSAALVKTAGPKSAKTVNKGAPRAPQPTH
jgi:hypothetical protein